MENIARIAKAAPHKLPEKSSLNLRSVCPVSLLWLVCLVCLDCPSCPFWPVCPNLTAKITALQKPTHICRYRAKKKQQQIMAFHLLFMKCRYSKGLMMAQYRSTLIQQRCSVLTCVEEYNWKGMKRVEIKQIQTRYLQLRRARQRNCKCHKQPARTSILR